MAAFGPIALLRALVSTPAGCRAGSILPPRWIRLVGVGLSAGALYSAFGAHVGGAAAGALVWLATLLFLGLYFVGQNRAIPLVLLGQAAAGIVLQWYQPNGIGFLIVIVAITQMSRLEPELGRTLALIAGLSFLGVFFVAVRPNTGGLLSISTGMVFAFIGASSFRRLREEKQRTEDLLREVVAGRDARIHAAALEERARLAREIHDILAHTLSALSLQLESAQLLLQQRPGDPAALVSVERAGKLAREGLGEGRRAVGALRGDDLPGPELLPRLVEEFERTTGVPCRLTVDGDPVILPTDARLALYRTAQEALTNVRKHARPTRVDLTLRYCGSEVDLTVENDGVEGSAGDEGGHGFIGLGERTELAHGRLQVGPIPGGFRIHLALPA